MAKPQIIFNDWTEERNPAWAKEAPTYNNLVIAGAILDVEEFTAAEDGRVEIPSGTLVMRALEDREDGPFVPFEPYDSVEETGYQADTHEAYLTYHGIYDARNNDEVTLYRHGRVVAYNKLPGWDDLDEGAQAAIHALYQTMHAAE